MDLHKKLLHPSYIESTHLDGETLFFPKGRYRFMKYLLLVTKSSSEVEDDIEEISGRLFWR